jgi:putative hydrolase of the HAD superfamily
VVRAVVFDLWQTLVPWPDEESARLRQSWADRLGISVEQLDGHWYGDRDAYRRRESGPLAPALTALCEAFGSDVPIEELFADRLAITRRALQLDPEVERTLLALRARGYPIGLVSNCTEEVAVAWPDCPLAPLVDQPIFSATAGTWKPDARIYELACEALSVEPAECLFVGDGANDELPGAGAVGMTAVLYAEGGVARWDGLEEWTGARITAIPDVLDLVA